MPVVLAVVQVTLCTEEVRARDHAAAVLPACESTVYFKVTLPELPHTSLVVSPVTVTVGSTLNLTGTTLSSLSAQSTTPAVAARFTEKFDSQPPGWEHTRVT